ncbi:MAG: glycoside-pentoside-hexuronide (GPH):cation symporter [Oscillospiraceae bacterium]|nr:glycoside-pentoside-hexuronide (GPH):cation symporter [Oscillospiraceae bacterium]
MDLKTVVGPAPEQTPEQPPVEETRASWATKINYGIGAMGKGLSYGVYGKLEMFLLEVLEINKAWLAPLLFIEKIWDGVNDMMMGMVIDNTHTRWGKFRPWCAIGAVTNAFMVIAVFGPPQGLRNNPVGLFIYITVFYFLWDATYTLVDVAYYAMIPALSSSQKERDQFAMIPRLFSGLIGIPMAFTMNIVERVGDGEGKEAWDTGLFRLAVVTSVIYLITSLYSAATTKEKLSLNAPLPEQDAKREKFSLLDALRILWNNKQVLVVVGVMILFNMACNLTNSAGGYYFLYVIDNTSQEGLLNLIKGGAQGIGLVLFPIVSGALGRKRVYSSTILLPCLGYLAMAVVNAAVPARSIFIPLAAATAIAFIGYGSMSVMQSVMLADGVDYGEHETGIRNEGIIFSMLTMLSKLAGAFSSVATMITFSVVKFGGEHATEATPLAQKGISFLMYVLPPILLVGAFLLYKFGYKLTPERMERVKAELAERKALGVLTMDGKIIARNLLINERENDE